MRRVLTINAGSSSIKFALFEQVGLLMRSLTGAIERIGLANTVISVKGANGPLAKEERFEAADIGQAGERLIGWLGEHIDFSALQGIGHRVVHGGPHHSQAQHITPELIEELERISSLDPDHLPGEIALIKILRLRLPGLPQVACFDTAFHHDMPRVAQLLAVPRRHESAGDARHAWWADPFERR